MNNWKKLFFHYKNNGLGQKNNESQALWCDKTQWLIKVNGQTTPDKLRKPYHNIDNLPTKDRDAIPIKYCDIFANP